MDNTILVRLATPDDAQSLVKLNYELNILEYNTMDFYCEIREHWQHIFMSYPYWCQTDGKRHGLSDDTKNKVLATMKEYWNEHFPDMALFSVG